MFSWTHLFYGIAAAVIGIAMLRFNFQLVNMTGRQDWIEDKLGGGSTYFVYKLFALAIIVFGILLMSGLANGFFTWLLSPLRGLFSVPGN